MPTALDDLKTKLYDVNALYAAMSMLDWDQQTYMPKGGANARAEHSSILARMAHEAFVSDETQRALEDAANEDQCPRVIFEELAARHEATHQVPSRARRSKEQAER